MTDTPASFVADVADHVVAWHNRHPLAQRISRSDVHSIGYVVLPFAREHGPAWHEPPPRSGLFQLLFPARVRSREWAVFNEDALPEIGTARLTAFAQRHGYHDRPGPAGLPERALRADPDLLGPRPGEDPPERTDRYLVTAAIDAGIRRSRVVIGAGRRPPVLGQRVWSLPRVVALGGAALLAVVGSAAILWLKALPGLATPPGDVTPPAPAAAASARPGVPGSGVSAPAAAASAQAPVLPPASGPLAGTAPAAALAASRPAAASATVPSSAASTALPASAASAVSATVPASAASAAVAASVAGGPASRATSATRPGDDDIYIPETQIASQPLVRRLRPDLAAALRRGSAGAASASAGQATPGARPGAPRFYALVSRPLRSRADAESQLRRLRTETDRIAHPTATQTGLQEGHDGWRVTWWPFTHPRQAENARAAMAARRIELEVVEF